MNQDRFGGRVKQALNHGLNDISPASARRLEAARHLALARQKQPAMELATAGGAAIFAGGGEHRHLKHILSIVALLLGMWMSFYWHSVQYVTELEEVDSALLADDISPEAFLDNDFFEWLKADDASEH